MRWLITTTSLQLDKKHTQEINKDFDGTLNNHGTMVFAAKQEQNEPYTFKDMFLQPENSYFILAMIKEVEAHKAIINWTLMKYSEVKNNYKNKDGKLNTI